MPTDMLNKGDMLRKVWAKIGPSEEHKLPLTFQAEHSGLYFCRKQLLPCPEKLIL